MQRFFLSGVYTVRQEVSFTTEIEAETPKQAAEKFKKLAETNEVWRLVKSVNNREFYDMHGTFDIYNSEDARDAWDNEELLISSFEFKGYI
jgi:hypothetical protein